MMKLTKEQVVKAFEELGEIEEQLNPDFELDFDYAKLDGTENPEGEYFNAYELNISLEIATTQIGLLYDAIAKAGGYEDRDEVWELEDYCMKRVGARLRLRAEQDIKQKYSDIIVKMYSEIETRFQELVATHESEY